MCERLGGFIITNHQVPPLTGSKKPRFFYGYVVVVAAFFIMVIYAGTLYSFGVFFKPLAAEFGWTRAVTAGAYSTCLFLTGLLYMVTGRLNDRFGPRLVITICGLILGIGYFLMSRINAVWQLYLFYGVIVAMGQSGGLIPIMSTIARWFVKRRGLMTGIVVAGVGVGIVVMPPVVTRLIDAYGWRTTYVVVSIITLVVLLMAAQFLRRDPSQVGQLPDGESRVKQASLVSETAGYSRREAFQNRQFWMLFAVYFCYGFLVQATLVHIVPHATDLGVSAITAAGILAVIGGVSAVGRIGIGSASDRVGNKQVLILVFVLALIAFLWIQFAKELWMLYLFAVIFGFAYGGLIALESPMTAELFGMKAHGAILGVVHFGATIGGAISAPLAGRLFDITGGYQSAFVVLAALSVTGIILASLLRLSRKGGLMGSV